ncbi:MAG: NUDIX hydrolase [Planctomycetes bacterium]|nr:NUDIX hydrolase [Planctomycetota bacterium]
MAKPKPAFLFRQAGALVLRGEPGALEVLLISSSGSGKLGIPKGIIDAGNSAEGTAAQESLEEAGVEVRVGSEVGAFEYAKWGGTCRVRVFRAELVRELDEWPERALRTRLWVPFATASQRVGEPSLASLLAELATSSGPGS